MTVTGTAEQPHEATGALTVGGNTVTGTGATNVTATGALNLNKLSMSSSGIGGLFDIPTDLVTSLVSDLVTDPILSENEET
jgi:hypothetical protein